VSIDRRFSIMSKDYSLAVNQVARIEQLCGFLAHPGLDAAIKSSVPVTMPQSEGSLGFDTPLWIGLGLVGLWSALDAYAERSAYGGTTCGTCGRRNCLSSRLASTGRLDETSEAVLGELEDIRHLFAHNYAGHVDSRYFSKTRHALRAGFHVPLLSGATFDGTNIALTAKHLRYYAGQSRKILTALT
jgi:hypothetical protein